MLVIILCSALALYIKIIDSRGSDRTTFRTGGRARLVDPRDIPDRSLFAVGSADSLAGGSLASSPMGIGVHLEPVRHDVPVPLIYNEYSLSKVPLSPEKANEPSMSQDALPGQTIYDYAVSGGEDGGSTGSIPRVLTGLVRVLYNEDPVYPMKALLEQIEGKVEVLVYVDSCGRVAVFPRRDDNGLTHWVTHYIISETPRGWDFAEAVIRALPRWRFMPRIESGCPVGCYVKIRHWFCIGGDCRQYEIDQGAIQVPH